MQRSYIKIYAFAVCFVSAATFSIALGKAIYDIVQISAPQFTMPNYDYKRLASNAALVKTWPDSREIPDDANLTQLRETEYKMVLQTEKRSGWQNIISSIITLLITSLFFCIHWFIATRETPISEGNESGNG